MNDDVILILAIAVIAAVAVLIGLLFVRRRRTAMLRARFGPEYDHVMRSSTTAGAAERTLLERERRVAAFSLRSLTRDDAERFTSLWKLAQARFVDDPRTAVVDADRLIGEVMRARGYPVEDPTQRLGDLSVEHAHVVGHYRSGREIVTRHEQGTASTEDLRQAMVHVRELFEALVMDTRQTRRAS